MGNIERFADCVDAWLTSKKLIHKVSNVLPISQNISLNYVRIKNEHDNLKPETELDSLFDELSSPEVISPDELEDDGEKKLEDNNEKQLENNYGNELEDSNEDTDLDTTLCLTALPNALVTHEQAIGEKGVINGRKKKARKRKRKSVTNGK